MSNESDNRDEMREMREIREVMLRLADMNSRVDIFSSPPPSSEAVARWRVVRSAMLSLLAHLAAHDPDHYRPKPGDILRHRYRADPKFVAESCGPAALFTEEGVAVHVVEETETEPGYYLVGFKDPERGETAVVYYSSPYLELAATP